MTILRLTRELALEYGPALLRLNPDSEWENWTMDNLLSERDGKWEFSLLALMGQTPIGYCILSRQAHGGHIHHVIVGTEWRGLGLGRRLIGNAARILQDAGAGVLSLKVHQTNIRARDLYLRLGFHVSGEVKDMFAMEVSVAEVAEKFKDA